MTKQAAELVAQALDLIERGNLTLENGSQVFGEAWGAVYPAVSLALQVNSASNPPLISERSFKPLDLAASWQALQTRLETTPQLAAPAQPRPVVHPLYSWMAGLRRFFITRPGQALGGSLIGLILVFFLALGVAESGPGDLLYRARLGWEYLGEFVELNPDQKAQVALHEADNRLTELENMAFVTTPAQLTEVQGQYLRALDASARYSASPQFHSYLLIYEHLNTQRDRVARLQQAEYIFGPGARLTYLVNRLNDTVYTLAPEVPGATLPPDSTPAPATPTLAPTK